VSGVWKQRAWLVFVLCVALVACSESAETANDHGENGDSSQYDAGTRNHTVAQDVDSTNAALPTVARFAPEVTVASPDGGLRIELGIDELARARYRIVRVVAGSDADVLSDSTLGLETSIGSFATPGKLTVLENPESVQLSVPAPHGKAGSVELDAMRQFIQLGAAADGLRLEVSVTNTAVAFRYWLDVAGQSFTIDWERSSFAVPPQSRAWLQEHDAPGQYTPAYERLRSREATAGNPGRSTYGWTFPALFESPGGWLLITETELGDGQAGSHLSAAATNGEFFLDYANWGEGNGVGDPRPTADDSWTSPWRLIVTSQDVGDIVESDAVRAFSLRVDSPPPTAPEWVIPGRVSWSWWSDHDSSQDADAMEPFIDLAQEMSWEYSLVDANWDLIADERMESLIAYAAERNVGLWLWYNSGGPNNGVTEAPRDRMADPATRRAEMARIAALGIRGIKVDFFHSDKPATIQLYRDILSDAFDAQLMVNFHGSTVPRGWAMEFPHLMSMEAVRGAEIYSFDARYQRVAARQNTTLPFTRNVVGSMDYTPVILGDSYLRSTTNSHELALAVVFESAVQHLVDTPDAYLGQPVEVVDLLSTVPTSWDETHFVAGEPESHVVIARRRAATWWIGGINALDESVTVTVDLDELGVEPGSAMVLICDSPTWEPTVDQLLPSYVDPTQYIITTDASPRAVALRLIPSGGCMARFGDSGN